MLIRVYVDNFRCMTNFECALGPRQLVLGPNGAGKSSLFEVLSLLRDFCIRGDAPDLLPPSPRFGGASRTKWQQVHEQIFELDVRGPEGLYLFRLAVDTYGSSERPRVLKEEVILNGKPIFRFEKGEVHLYNDKSEDKVQYPFDWHRSALATIAERRDNMKLSWFKRWFAGVLCIQPDPWSMRGIAAEEAERPDRHLSNFADWYRHMRQETTDQEYIADLRKVIAHFDTMRLEGAGEGRREIKVRMDTRTDGKAAKREEEYLLSELSEGQRVLIGLYAVLHFALKPGATICFDEPDNFIALAEVQPWLTGVLDRTEDDDASQVLIASHHPEILNRMAFKEGLLLDRPGGRQTRVRRLDDPSGTGLSAAELIARGWDHE